MSNKEKLTCKLEIIPPSVYFSPCPQFVALTLLMLPSAKQSGLPSIFLQMLANIEETSPCNQNVELSWQVQLVNADGSNAQEQASKVSPRRHVQMINA
jgi:hypothetical protein